MTKRIALIVSFALVIASFIIGIYFYSSMPDRMASHWNIKGEVNDYLPKFWGLFLMPIISLACLLLFVFIPYMDPLKMNIKKFRKYYDYFILILMLFLFYIYIITILWNLGFELSMNRLIIPALAVLFFYIGLMLGKVKRNWFIGIRTPWTLTNDKVWDKTHKLGGKLFMIVGVIALLGIFFENYAFLLIFFHIIFVSVFLFAYSYILFRKRLR